MKQISANFNEFIVGERIFLKKYKLIDKNLVSQFAKVSKENHNYIFEYTEWDNKLLTEKDIVNYIKSADEAWKNQNRATYAIVEKSSGKFIGDIKIFDLDFKNQSGEIGIWCSKEFKGKGYASEAINLLSSNFAKKGITLLKAKVSVKNEASNNLVKRNGFKEFGEEFALFTNVYYKTIKTK
ncbi:MAG: GNAT family N-acetyltransferase [Alphaproteobacteria bacterium]|nr:GNAT family N-acetyltransferase [Alphaproteobacteria bacterium]MBR4315755.1 GNAT family N-acetyltransferase [Alphaproteobacteria bacterium]